MLLVKNPIFCAVLIFQLTGCSVSQNYCDERFKMLERDQYIEIYLDPYESSKSLEPFLDISNFSYCGDVVIFIPYIDKIYPTQLDEEVMSYATRGISGNATIVYMRYVSAFSIKQKRTVVAYKRMVDLKYREIGWDLIDLGEVEIGPSDNIFEKMARHYEEETMKAASPGG